MNALYVSTSKIEFTKACQVFTTLTAVRFNA